MNVAARERADARAASLSIVRNIKRTIVPTNIAALKSAGLTVEPVDDTEYRIAGKYAFFPATGFWRSLDGRVKGYTAGTLIAEARLGDIVRNIDITPEIHEPPAIAGDSVGIVPCLSGADNPGTHAGEAMAGEPTSAMLPKVTP